jgi:hypothetical protein
VNVVTELKSVEVGVGVNVGVLVGVSVGVSVTVGVGVVVTATVAVGVGVIEVNDVQYPFAVNQAEASDVFVNGVSPILGGIELHKIKKAESVSPVLLQNPKNADPPAAPL